MKTWIENLYHPKTNHPLPPEDTSIGTYEARPLLTKIALGASSGYKANRVVCNHSENGRRGRPHCRQFGGREGLGGDRINVTNVFGTTRPTRQGADRQDRHEDKDRDEKERCDDKDRGKDSKEKK